MPTTFRRRRRWLDRTDWQWIGIAMLIGIVIGLGAVWVIEMCTGGLG